MALVTLTNIAEIRGSIGLTTFSRNRAGLYARERKGPNDNTGDYRTKCRNALLALGGIWSSTFSDAQRQQWVTFARAHPATNRIGQPATRAGMSAFIQLAFRHYVLLQGTIDTPPADPRGPTIAVESFSGYYLDAEAYFSWLITSDDPSNTVLAIWSTRTLGPTQKPRKQDMGWLNLASDMFYPLVGTDYTIVTARFPEVTPNVGQRYAWLLVPVHRDTGAAGPPVLAECVLNEAP